MKLIFREHRSHLAEDYGIHLLAQDFLPEEFRRNYLLAMDAQPSMVTTGSNGIPAYLLNYIDPKVIEVLVTPMRAAEILGEVKKGSWVDLTAQFQVAEATGEVAAYGDYSNNGTVGANFNWEERQNYLFQTVTQWGDQELERAGAARIDYAARLQRNKALVMNKFMNKSYFYGINGLKNYGLLNDPSLPAPIAPANVGGMTLWSGKDAAGIYADIQALFTQLVSQTGGHVNRQTPMKLCMSTVSETELTKTNQYNVNVSDQLAKNFPNMRIETAVEYATTGGNLVQLIVDAVDGDPVAECAFSEKMRTHNVVRDLSAYKQKNSAGTLGTVIYRPNFIAQLLGV